MQPSKFPINEWKRRWRHRTVSAPGTLQVALQKFDLKRLLARLAPEI
jgi:hypothetical protein